MTSRKSFSKSMSPSSHKQAANTILTNFNFKQLEEDNENLAADTGKSENFLVDSQHTHRRSHERTPSTSSVSSTSSISGETSEVTHPLMSSLEEIVENVKASLKPTSLFSTEISNSSLKTAALAKFETSKDIFSGLKGKITDKISKTIEEFSGEHSYISSPDKEKSKLAPLHKKSKSEVDVKDIPFVSYDAALPTKPVLSATFEDTDVQDSHNKSVLSHAHSETDLPFTQNTPKSGTDTTEIVSENNRTIGGNKVISNIVSSDHVVIHLIAKSETGDEFEDFINQPQSKLSIKESIGNSTENNHINTQVSSTHLSDNAYSESEGVISKHGSTIVQPPSVQLEKELSTNKNESKTFNSKISNLNSYSDKSNTFSAMEQSKVDNVPPGLDVPDQRINNKSNKGKPNPVSSKSVMRLLVQHLRLKDMILHHRLISFVILIIAYLVLPLPSFLSGFILGIVLASLVWAVYVWLIKQQQSYDHFLHSQKSQPQLLPELKVTVEGEEFLYKGWLNELKEYNVEDYHINKTQSIFVSLEGTRLRIQKPKTGVPKRAMWDEVLPKPHFINQRHFDLPGSKVSLLPHGLVKKRIWSKKYPICIVLAERNSSGDVRIKHSLSDSVVLEKKVKVSEINNEFVTDEKSGHSILYLFARTSREKEEWFKRFLAAASNKPLANHVLEIKRLLPQNTPAAKKNADNTHKHKRQGSTSSAHSFSMENLSESSIHKSESLDLVTFAYYMGRLMPSGSLSGTSSSPNNSPSKDVGKTSFTKESNKNSLGVDLNKNKMQSSGLSPVSDNQMFWINALIGRCFFDFLRDKWWNCKVKDKLQRKLSKLHVPYFIEEFKVTDINLGCEVPDIRHADKPYMDERGFWVDLDIAYAGGFQMTIETKINLMKLKKTSHLPTFSEHPVNNLKSAITNSDEEDSAESTTDEDEEVPNSEDNSSTGGASKKLLHYLNKFTQSKYFQQATEYKVIKRAMENVSNTPLILTVTVISLVGKLALNIPPPPTNRLWYGFRGNPHLRLSAKPQVGERAVTITHIVEWIEKKLGTEFQRVFVMPNMDDLIIPILVPGEGNESTKSSIV